MRRRNFLRGSSVAAATAAGGLQLGPSFWQAALAAPATGGEGPYGPLLPPDANGVMLPEGFTSRVVAVSGQTVPGTDYEWHGAPDGAATFPAEDGGWFHAVNSEISPARGGVGVIRYDADGEITDAYRILSNTSQNCAGGATPWGTWLSGEEVPTGFIWECDPTQPGQGVQRPFLGQFSHEAAAVDPERQQLYLTEDLPTGHYYRFTPADYPDLSAGMLEAAVLDDDGNVTWMLVPVPAAQAQPQTFGVATDFDGGEGIWYDPAGTGYTYFTTKGTNQVWVHDLEADRITVLYDAADFPEGEAPLTGVDNIVVAPSGDLFIGEDGGNLETVIIAADTRETAPFARLTGPEHDSSEVTGPCFSPDGTRLYFSSQRGGAPDSGIPGPGVTFEVSGPFRLQRAGIAADGAPTTPVPQVRRTVTRIDGADRYATAAEIATTAASLLGGVDTVHLALGTNFPDGVAAGPLVIADGSVLLLTATDTLPPVTGRALAELAPDRVIALGGTTAISDRVLADAGKAADDASTTRVQGADRFATAAAIADELASSDRAFLAVGTDFPDALAGGAATDGSPILLVENDSLTKVTAAALRERRPSRVVALGGSAVISPAVLDAAAEAAGGATTSRLDGQDRYATAVAIAETLDAPTAAVVALGTDYPDALAAAPLAGAIGGPVLLTASDRLPDVTRDWLAGAEDVTRIFVLGGEQAISADVLAAIRNAIS